MDVEKFVVFGNFHQNDLDALAKSRHNQELTRAVSQMAAETSLKLKDFSGAFLVEAGDFFSSCKSSWKWDNLQSLVLTSQLLVPESDSTELDQMFKDAAAAAMKMPRLDTMEIWNGKGALASLFRYQSERGQTNATVTWRSTWELSLPSPVTQAWSAVAKRHGARGLAVNSEILDIREHVECHGDAIRHLQLSKSVIRPVSLQQICAEHNIQNHWKERRNDWRRAFMDEMERLQDPNNRDHQEVMTYLRRRYAPGGPGWVI